MARSEREGRSITVPSASQWSGSSHRSLGVESASPGGMAARTLTASSAAPSAGSISMNPGSRRPAAASLIAARLTRSSSPSVISPASVVLSWTASV
jgi:hypothetical protein